MTEDKMIGDIVCPFCHSNDCDFNSLLDQYFSNDLTVESTSKFSCNDCGKDFYVEERMEITYRRSFSGL